MYYTLQDIIQNHINKYDEEIKKYEKNKRGYEELKRKNEEIRERYAGVKNKIQINKIISEMGLTLSDYTLMKEPKLLDEGKIREIVKATKHGKKRYVIKDGLLADMAFVNNAESVEVLVRLGVDVVEAMQSIALGDIYNVVREGLDEYVKTVDQKEYEGKSNEEKRAIYKNAKKEIVIENRQKILSFHKQK